MKTIRMNSMEQKKINKQTKPTEDESTVGILFVESRKFDEIDQIIYTKSSYKEYSQNKMNERADERNVRQKKIDIKTCNFSEILEFHSVMHE